MRSLWLGIVPRIREEVSPKRLKSMGFNYIAALHDYVPGLQNDPVGFAIKGEQLTVFPWKTLTGAR
jgi:hypothetical protein